ncbi:MAG: HAMP domain-containing sensor histidine kinase, partial [Dehalococcoidia bacterium]
ENLRLDDLEGRRGVQLEGMKGAKADFIRGVAHRMITPLTVIKASTSMMIEVLGRRVSGERAELLSRIGSGIAQLEKQASELLELFRIRAAAIELSPEPVEVNGLVAETCDNLTLEFRARGQTVELHLLRHSLRALLDRRRFGEVLAYLLSSAGRFAPEGGHIEVRVAIEESGLVVGVSDNGPGILGEDRDRIFDPFYRAGRPGKRAGAGLELARARSLAELQGGSLRVESDADEGASFLFSVPLRGVPVETEGKTFSG